MLRRCSDIAKVYLGPALDKPASVNAFDQWVQILDRKLEQDLMPLRSNDIQSATQTRI